jgi:hypothetical protein
MELRPFKWTSGQSDLSYTEGHALNISIISSTSTKPTFDACLRTSRSILYHSTSLPLAPLLHLAWIDKEMRYKVPLRRVVYSPHFQFHTPIHQSQQLHRTFDFTIRSIMSSLAPSTFTPSMGQGTPTGSFATRATVEGLPDDIATLLPKEMLEDMTLKQSEDLEEYFKSPEFQLLLEQEDADE